MPCYTLVAGVNGVGKSSLTGVLKAERIDLGCVIDVDKIGMDRGCNALEAGRIAVAKSDACLSRGITFTQETTLSGYRIERTVKYAKARGYAIRLFYIGLNTLDESKKRISNRVEKGGHDIPAADVERRFTHRIASLTRILPYCDEAHFYDNENGFTLVGEYRNGEIITMGDYRPRWLCELLERHNA